MHSRSQYLTVRSAEPLAKALLYGLNSIQDTAASLICLKLARTLFAVTSQILRVPSLLPDATHFPSGESRTELTTSVCSRKVATH